MAAGCCPWGHKELDTTEQTHTDLSLLLFRLLVLSASETAVLKSPVLIVDLFLSPFIYHSLVSPFWLLDLKSYLDMLYRHINQ